MNPTPNPELSISAIANAPVLYIDTTHERLMLGLSIQGQLVGRYEELCDSHRYHSALMTPAIQNLLKEADVTPQSLAGIAVNIGPGSFTGVRTGIITARTMAQFLPVRVFAFNSFELLALADEIDNEAKRQIRAQATAVYFNARRGKSFHATLSESNEGPVYTRQPGLVQLPDAFDDEAASVPRILAVESLRECLPDVAAIAYFSQMPFTPPRMLQLLQRYEAAFERPWQQVLPLYLQEPSITLKKPPILF
jgi:tRNA threonylcarbamoyl adenosine modification protein YeaZ